MSSQVKRGGKVWKAVVGVISTVIIAGLFVALLVLTASGRWIDSVSSDSASVSHAVSQRRITAYCPSRMTLPDASRTVTANISRVKATSRLRPDSPRSERCTGLSSARLAAPAIPRSSRTSTLRIPRTSSQLRPTSTVRRCCSTRSCWNRPRASALPRPWRPGRRRATCAACPRHSAMSVRWSSRSCCLTRRPAPLSSWVVANSVFEALWWMFGCGVRNSPVRWRCPREAR